MLYVYLKKNLAKSQSRIWRKELYLSNRNSCKCKGQTETCQLLGCNASHSTHSSELRPSEDSTRQVTVTRSSLKRTTKCITPENTFLSITTRMKVVKIMELAQLPSPKILMSSMCRSYLKIRMRNFKQIKKTCKKCRSSIQKIIKLIKIYKKNKWPAHEN